MQSKSVGHTRKLSFFLHSAGSVFRIFKVLFIHELIRKLLLLLLIDELRISRFPAVFAVFIVSSFALCCDAWYFSELVSFGRSIRAAIAANDSLSLVTSFTNEELYDACLLS